MTFSQVQTTPSLPDDAQPQLVNMWRSAIRKARAGLDEQAQTKPAQDGALIINFDGAGSPVRVGMGGVPQMPPGAWRIIGAHIVAAVWNPTDARVVPITASATVELQLTHLNNWVGVSTPLYGTGIRPTLAVAAEADVDITGWQTDLQPGDMISYGLRTFSGSASILTLTLALRRIELTGVSETNVIDSAGDILVDSSGRSIVIRG